MERERVAGDLQSKESKGQKHQWEGLCQRNLAFFFRLSIPCSNHFMFFHILLNREKRKNENGRFLRSLTADELSGSGSGSEKVKLKKEKQNKQKKSLVNGGMDVACKKKQTKVDSVELPFTNIFLLHFYSYSNIILW